MHMERTYYYSCGFTIFMVMIKAIIKCDIILNLLKDQHQNTTMKVIITLALLAVFLATVQGISRSRQMRAQSQAKADKYQGRANSFAQGDPSRAKYQAKYDKHQARVGQIDQYHAYKQGLKQNPPGNRGQAMGNAAQAESTGVDFRNQRDKTSQQLAKGYQKLSNRQYNLGQNYPQYDKMRTSSIQTPQDGQDY
jgi:hypothetical protein